MKKDVLKSILLGCASMLFFLAFSIAIFMFVSLIAPEKPTLFESIRIDGVESVGGANEK